MDGMLSNMFKFILEPTATAQWHALVAEAQAHCGQTLAEELESYLVFLLQRFTAKPDIAKSVLAMDYLRSAECHGTEKQLRLREVADKCLLFSGLYPEQAERKCVNITYFIELGQSAYANLAELHNAKRALAALYAALGEGFIRLMNLLHCIRELGNDQLELSPLQAEALWRKTGSQYALALLRKLTNSLPIANDDFSANYLH